MSKAEEYAEEMACGPFIEGPIEARSPIRDGQHRLACISCPACGRTSYNPGEWDEEDSTHVGEKSATPPRSFGRNLLSVLAGDWGCLASVQGERVEELLIEIRDLLAAQFRNEITELSQPLDGPVLVCGHGMHVNPLKQVGWGWGYGKTRWHHDDGSRCKAPPTTNPT